MRSGCLNFQLPMRGGSSVFETFAVRGGSSVFDPFAVRGGSSVFEPFAVGGGSFNFQLPVGGESSCLKQELEHIKQFITEEAPSNSYGRNCFEP